jgi:hypothetical protein
MRRAVFVLMLATAVFAGLAPLLEAGCTQECVGDAAADGCAQDACCSCCLHFRVDPPQDSPAAAQVIVSGRLLAPRVHRLSSPDPREILHVPKAIAL